MKHLPLKAKSEDMYEFCIEWWKLLELEKFDDAHAMLYVGEHSWSPQKIEKCIKEYGRVTDPSKAKGRYLGFGESCYEPAIKLRIDVHPSLPIQVEWTGEKNRQRPTLVGSMALRYPFNNKWSDVTSPFFIHKLKTGLGVELCDIAVS